MAHYDARLYTDKGIEILNTKIECTPENIPDMLVCIVTDYLKERSLPGRHKGPRHKRQKIIPNTLLLLENGIALDVYRHVEKAAREGGAGTVPAPSLHQADSGHGGGGPMIRYEVRLYTNNGVKICNKKIECNEKEISDRLAGIVLDYLRGAPYSGAIKAHVITGKIYTEYMLLLKCDILASMSPCVASRQGGGAGTPVTGRNLPDDPLQRRALLEPSRRDP